MAILRRIPKDIKERVYTHKGYYAGIVPVYIIIEDGIDYESGEHEMFMAERNGIPRYSINVVKFIWELLTVFHPITPPVFITSEL